MNTFSTIINTSTDKFFKKFYLRRALIIISRFISGQHNEKKEGNKSKEEDSLKEEDHFKEETSLICEWIGFFKKKHLFHRCFFFVLNMLKWIPYGFFKEHFWLSGGEIA